MSYRKFVPGMGRWGVLLLTLLLWHLAEAQAPWTVPGQWQNNQTGYLRDVYTRYKTNLDDLAKARSQLDHVNSWMRNYSGTGLWGGAAIGTGDADTAIRQQALRRRVAELEQTKNALEAEWESKVRPYAPLAPLTDISRKCTEYTLDNSVYPPKLVKTEVDAIEYEIRHFVEGKQAPKGAGRTLGKLGTIEAGGDATIVRTDPETRTAGAKAGQTLLQKGGSFDDKEGPPGVLVGPVAVPCACKIKGHVVGNPPVAGGWSLGNWNTGISVSFDPLVGGSFASGGEVIGLGGQLKDNDLTGEATLSGPGRLWMWVGRPRGSGPLSGGYFKQSYQASVVITEILADWRATAVGGLKHGDRVVTHGSPTTLKLADGSRVIVFPGSELELTEPEPGIVQVNVTKGRIRFTSFGPGGKYKTTQVAVAGKIVRPHGTDYLIEVRDNTGLVQVVEGAVSVGGGVADIIVKAGQQFSWPDGKVSQFDQATAGPAQFEGVPLAPEYTDSAITQPFGSTVAKFRNGKLSEGWLWEDPGQDVKYETPAPGTLQVTVPNENDLWDYRYKAPRLLHKVTGDFTLEADAQLIANSTDWTGMDFVVKAPGTYFGFLRGEMRQENPAADYWIPGSCLYKTGDGAVRTSLPEIRSADSPIMADGKARVRFLRRGDLWLNYWSADGKRWQLSGQSMWSLPDTLWVGWVFKRQAWDGRHSEPGIFTLNDVKLTTGPRGTLEVPAWNTIIRNGDFRTQGDKVTLSLAGAATGDVNAWSGCYFDGDFDVSVSFDTGPWTHQPGDSRWWALDASSPDSKYRVYMAGGQIDEFGKQRFSSDICTNGNWGHYQWLNKEDKSGKFRLTREKDLVSAYYWEGGKWVKLSKDEIAITTPLHLRLVVSNVDKAAHVTPMNVTFIPEKLLVAAPKVTPPAGEGGSTGGGTTGGGKTGGDKPQPPVKPAGDVPEMPAGTWTVLQGPGDNEDLGNRYARDDFRFVVWVNYLKGGTVLDTVGVNAARPGDFCLQVGDDGTVTFQIFDPATRTVVGNASGWHVLTCQKALTPKVAQLLIVDRVRGVVRLQAGPRDNLQMRAVTLGTPLSGNKAYLGDFPGDAAWANVTEVRRGMKGAAKVEGFGQ